MRIAFLLLMAGCSWAQLRVEISPVTGRASDRLKEAQRRLQRAQQLVWRDIRAPEERAVVEEARESYREFFLPEIGSEPRIATLTEGGIDILVARWTLPGDGSGFSELTVWDTPEVTWFNYRLPRASWSSDAAIRATFERLVHARSGALTKVEFDVNVNVARDPQTHQWIGAGGFPPAKPYLRQFDQGVQNWLDFWETPTASYLCVYDNLQWRFSSYPGTRFIPERFPPLESRVGQWSNKRLIDDLSQPGILARDLIIARELAKRDLTKEELLTVFESRARLENGAFLQGIVDAGQTGRYAGAIRQYLVTHQQAGVRRSTYEEPDPFRIVSRAKDPNFTDAKLEQLRQVHSAYYSFLRAAANCATPADYRALKERPCPDDALAPACGRALQEMRKRLGLDEDGNPLTPK